MSRTDILSEIKEAEQKADQAVSNAETEKKNAVAQALSAAVKWKQAEVAKIRADAEAAIAAEQASLEESKAAKIAEGETEAAGIEEAARDKIKEVNDFLTNEFERAINASS